MARSAYPQEPLVNSRIAKLPTRIRAIEHPLLGACQRSSVDNVFVLPDSYTGPLLLILLAESEQAYEIVDGQNLYEFSGTGVLCVRSFDNFTQQWYRLHARYKDGTPIPQADETEFTDTRVTSLGQRWSATMSKGVDGPTDQLSDPELLFAVGSSDQIQSIHVEWQKETPRFKRDYCMSASQ